ncbi:MAG: hypothetical protein Q8P41_22585 [Pseudomonadota bacterium]|nr:hypothetical protein [Pseudomonadota bacterium]
MCFRTALDGALAEGWRWFETPVGPGSGARVTCGAPGARAGSRPDHAWGEADWLGLRAVDGRISTKPYHRAGRVPTADWPPRPVCLPLAMEPRLAARWAPGGVVTTEVYLRTGDATPWARVARAAAHLARGDAPRPPFPVHTRPGGLGMSLRYVGAALQAVTVVAWHYALPPEPELESTWAAALPPAEAAAYRALLHLGERAGVDPWRRHLAVSWTSTPSGDWSPAACLVAPPPESP